MTANPPVPGGGRPLPYRSQQMVDETGFPRGKGSGNCPTFCSFSQPCTSPSWPVPAQKGLAGPREPGDMLKFGFCHPAGMFKVSQAGFRPVLAAWAVFSTAPRAWGRRASQCLQVSLRSTWRIGVVTYLKCRFTLPG